MKSGNFLTELVSRYRKFMLGRYGNDELNFALILLSLLFSLVSNFDKLWFFYFISIALVGIAVWRTLSRNTNARYNERMKFITAISLLKNKFIKFKNHRVDKKTHKFYTCKKCKAKLRLPKGRGKIKITCPKCGNIMIKKT